MGSNDTTTIVKIVQVLVGSLGLISAIIPLIPRLLYSILDNKLQWDRNLGLNSCATFQHYVYVF